MTVPGSLQTSGTQAGTVRVSELRAHWQVSEPTARKILTVAGLSPVGAGWDRYLWREIWRLEGESFVPRHDWVAFKAPLLKTADLVDLDLEQRSERTLRRYLERGLVPSIRLSPGIVRVRRTVFETAIHYA